MKKFKKSSKHVAWLISCAFLFIFLLGCEQQSVDPVDETSKIDPRIVAMVAEATDDPQLQREMEVELQFLVDKDRVQIDDVSIWYSEGDQDFDYLHGGDQATPRDQVQESMEYYKNNPPTSSRSHRHAGTTGSPLFVNNGTYTVYVHSSVPSAWVTAIGQAYNEWNGLNLTVDFRGYLSSNKYNYGAITVYMENITGAYADAPDPYSDGRPGRRIRIDTDAPYLNAGQKKLVIAHELGHTIGFKHTDTYDGAPATSSYYSCISSSCDGTDGNSVMNTWDPVPSWSGFSTCDQDVFSCIYGLV